MDKIYESFLLSAGECFKSKNLLAHAYGKAVVWLLSYIFHIKHYDKDAILKEIKLQAPQRASDKTLFRKIKRAYFKYRCSAREYLVYDFENKTPKEIKSYLLDIQKIVLITLINNRKVLKTLNAKHKAYEVFKPYYKREILYVSNKYPVTLKEFSIFVNKHKEFICKPSNMSLGRGIKKYDIAEFSSVEEVYTEIQKRQPVILEELLYNDETFAAFHPESLNIVRVIAFKLKSGKIKIQRAYLSVAKVIKITQMLPLVPSQSQLT